MVKTGTDEKASASGPRTSALSRPGHNDDFTASLNALFDESILLIRRLSKIPEEMHKGEKMTAGKRGVLRLISRLGPQTVPQIARARLVTRQHIQTLIDSLLEDGFVELADNPAHKRSRLVRLTTEGEDVLTEMMRREATIFSELATELAKDDLQSAAALLRTIREFFESKRWKKQAER